MLIFDWDEANRNHLARHNIRPAEAEEVLTSSPVVLAVKDHDLDSQRIRVIGETSSGRILIVILTWRGPAVRVITGWDAPRLARQSYLQQKSGEHE